MNNAAILLDRLANTRTDASLLKSFDGERGTSPIH
jgi:hypothetical protein